MCRYLVINNRLDFKARIESLSLHSETLEGARASVNKHHELTYNKQTYCFYHLLRHSFSLHTMIFHNC